MFRIKFLLGAMTLSLFWCSPVFAQSPSVIYTWDGVSSVEDWGKNFGTNTVTFNNDTVGELTIIETGGSGEDVAIRDGTNRVRETSTQSGGLDLTGLDYLEFDLGHNGAGDVDVQFYVQASTGYNYVSLAPDVAISSGVHTYQLPLSNLTFEQQVYIRTLGFSIRDHLAEGDLTWTLEEVRSGGTPLTHRFLAKHNVGASDNGLQGAIVNFTPAAVQGNDGGQNQTGLSHNTSGPGSLQWTDLGDHGVGDPSGAAITWANGTEWYNDNSFYERMTDASNYNFVTFRMKATDALGGGGNLGVQAFFQTDNDYNYQAAGFLNMPIDGAYHELTFPLSGLEELDVIDWTGVNLAAHTNDLVIDVDYVRFMIPEPSTAIMLGIACAACLGMRRRVWRKG